MCKILVVDDEREVREIVGVTLAATGHQVLEAENGRAALELLEKNTEEPPCLLIVDLRMPVLDGWDLLAILRDDARWRSIPIVLFSASIEHGSPKPVLAARAYWPKPPPPEQLEAIQEYCPRHGQTWRSESGVRRRVLDPEEPELLTFKNNT